MNANDKVKKLKLAIGNMALKRVDGTSVIHVPTTYIEDIRMFAITPKERLPIKGLEVNTLEVDEKNFVTLIEELGVTDWFMRDWDTGEFLTGHYTASVTLRDCICKPLLGNMESDNPLPLPILDIGAWLCTWLNYNLNVNERPIIQLEYID